MSKLKIKAPYYNMESTQDILSDFIPAFNEFSRSEDNIRFGCNNMSKNLIRVETKSKTLFKDKTPICPKCESKKIYTDGKVTRKLVFLIKGTQIVLIEKYKCKNCGKKFKTDLSSLVNPNSNITLPVIELVKSQYRIFNGSLHEIRESLKKDL